MRTPTPLPAALGATSFTSRHAHLSGVSSSRLRASDLHHPFHAVYTPRPAEGIRALCRAYVRVMPVGAYFSHHTAAALLGVPLSSELMQGPLHVAVEFPRSPPRARGVIGHSLGSVEGTMIDSLPVAAPAHVWCQLSGVVNRDDLVAAGDHLVGARGRVPLVTRDDLAALADELHRTKGARSHRWALERIQFGSDSRPESLLRLLLEGCGFEGLAVNAPVPVDEARLLLHPDLTLAHHRVAFEYEGDGHRVDQRQWHLDIGRQELLEREGWRVMRVTARDVFHDRAAFVARVRKFVPNVE